MGSAAFCPWEITIVESGLGVRGVVLTVEENRALSSFEPDFWLRDDRSDEEEDEVVETEFAVGYRDRG